MISLIDGVSVEVSRKVQTGTDSYGGPIYQEESFTVDNVLPQPGSTSDLDATRPEGVTVAMTFHFPKTFIESLKGCAISYLNRTYRVIGDPQPYLKGATPGPWNRAVETEVCDG